MCINLQKYIYQYQSRFCLKHFSFFRQFSGFQISSELLFCNATEYLPDDATDETENPLMADKQIDTSAVSTPAKDKFQINYNYSFTK